jgi:hypothetical protein
MAIKVYTLIYMLCERIVAFLHTDLRSSKVICSSRDGGSIWKVWRMDVGMPLGKVENQELPILDFPRNPLHGIRRFSVCSSGNMGATISS